MAEPTLEAVFAGATQTLETVTIPKDSLSTLAPKTVNTGDQVSAGILSTLQKFYVPELRARDPDVSIVADPAIQIPDLYSADRPYHVFVLGFALFYESKIPELRADLLGLPGPRKLVILARVRIAVLGSYPRLVVSGPLLRVRVGAAVVPVLREDSAIKAIARVQVGTVPAWLGVVRVVSRVRLGASSVAPLLTVSSLRAIARVVVLAAPMLREDSNLKAIARVVVLAAPMLREDSNLKAIARVVVLAAPMLREDSNLKAIARVQVSTAAPWLVVFPVRVTARLLVVRQFPQLAVLSVGARVSISSLVSVPRRVDSALSLRVQIRSRS